MLSICLSVILWNIYYVTSPMKNSNLSFSSHWMWTRQEREIQYIQYPCFCLSKQIERWHYLTYANWSRSLLGLGVVFCLAYVWAACEKMYRQVHTCFYQFGLNFYLKSSYRDVIFLLISNYSVFTTNEQWNCLLI